MASNFNSTQPLPSSGASHTNTAIVQGQKMQNSNNVNNRGSINSQHIKMPKSAYSSQCSQQSSHTVFSYDNHEKENNTYLVDCDVEVYTTNNSNTTTQQQHMSTNTTPLQSQHYINIVNTSQKPDRRNSTNNGQQLYDGTNTKEVREYQNSNNDNFKYEHNEINLNNFDVVDCQPTTIFLSLSNILNPQQTQQFSLSNQIESNKTINSKLDQLTLQEDTNCNKQLSRENSVGKLIENTQNRTLSQQMQYQQQQKPLFTQSLDTLIEQFQKKTTDKLSQPQQQQQQHTNSNMMKGNNNNMGKSSSLLMQKQQQNSMYNSHMTQHQKTNKARQQQNQQHQYQNQFIRVEGESSGPPSMLIGYSADKKHYQQYLNDQQHQHEENGQDDHNDEESTILQTMQHSMINSQVKQLPLQQSSNSQNFEQSKINIDKQQWEKADSNALNFDQSQKENNQNGVVKIGNKQYSDNDLNSTKKTLILSENNPTLQLLNSQHKVRFAEEVYVQEISCRSSTDISKESVTQQFQQQAFNNSLSPRRLQLAPQLEQKIVDIQETLTLSQQKSCNNNGQLLVMRNQQQNNSILNNSGSHNNSIVAVSSCSMMERIQEAKNNNKKYEQMIEEFKRNGSSLSLTTVNQNDQQIDNCNIQLPQKASNDLIVDNDKHNNSSSGSVCEDDTQKFLRLEHKIMSECSVKHATVNLMQQQQFLNQSSMLQQNDSIISQQQNQVLQTQSSVSDFQNNKNDNNLSNTDMMSKNISLSLIDDKQQSFNRTLTLGSLTHRNNKRQSLELQSISSSKNNNSGSSRNKQSHTKGGKVQQKTYKQQFLLATGNTTLLTSKNKNQPLTQRNHQTITSRLTTTNNSSTNLNKSQEKKHHINSQQNTYNTILSKQQQSKSSAKHLLQTLTQNTTTNQQIDLSLKRTSSVPKFTSQLPNSGNQNNISQTTSNKLQSRRNNGGSLFKSVIVQPYQYQAAPGSSRLNQRMTASMINTETSALPDVQLVLSSTDDNNYLQKKQQRQQNASSSVGNRSMSSNRSQQEHNRAKNRNSSINNNSSSLSSKKFFYLDSNDTLNNKIQIDSNNQTQLSLKDTNSSLMMNRSVSQQSQKNYSLIQKSLMKAQAAHQKQQLLLQQQKQQPTVSNSNQLNNNVKQFILDKHAIANNSGGNNLYQSAAVINHEQVVNSNKTPHFNQVNNAQNVISSIEKQNTQHQDGMLKRLSLLSESQNSNQKYNLMSALKMSSPSTLNGGDTPQKHYQHQVLMSPLPPQSEEDNQLTSPAADNNDNDYQFTLLSSSAVKNPQTNQPTAVRFSMKNVDIRSSLEKECGISPPQMEVKNAQAINMQVLYHQLSNQHAAINNNEQDVNSNTLGASSMQQQQLMLGNVTNFSSSSMTTPFSNNQSLNNNSSRMLQQKKLHFSQLSQNISNNNNHNNVNNNSTNLYMNGLNSARLTSINNSNTKITQQQAVIGPVFFSGDYKQSRQSSTDVNKINDDQHQNQQPLVIFVCPYQCDHCRIQEQSSNNLEDISQTIQHTQKLRQSLQPDSQEETLEQLIQQQKEIEMKIQRLLNNTK